MFSAVLLAANELSSHFSFVAEHMAPCFPPEWSIEVIWTACVAQICAGQILKHIGGPKGEELSYIATAQLLGLVAWVEIFRETIEEGFPDMAGVVSNERQYFDKLPTLLREDGKTVDLSGAKDSLAFFNNMLWDAHEAGKIEFIYRTKETTEKTLSRTYM